jgi:hypothetical protein
VTTRPALACRQINTGIYRQGLDTHGAVEQHRLLASGWSRARPKKPPALRGSVTRLPPEGRGQLPRAPTGNLG